MLFYAAEVVCAKELSRRAKNGLTLGGAHGTIIRADLILKTKYASVAQWIGHQIPVLGVGGSSPFGRAKKKKNSLGCSFSFWRHQ